ncbi:DUF5778 family protein [Haloarculaceae archaeon H-GB2-1]|nr:DUF5778 family protein [Haloarculaceae archaeon H-GB1-1]MEA5407433.1 DUF5778 family protein [Haloarculaceae archaeon H-GB2-1]
MSEETIDNDLYQRTQRLLEPGDIELVGAIVHTDYDSGQEAELHQATLEVGDVIADYAVGEDTYVYSGNDDPDFGVNQHQGRTLDGDEFVWECQQLLREETFDVVFYYEADVDQDSLIEDVRDAGYTVVGVDSP